MKNIDNNHLIQTLNTLTTDKNLAHVLNATNPKFAKYSNGPIEGINRKTKLLRRLSFGMPNFTKYEETHHSLKMMHTKFWAEPKNCPH
ncbi:transposase [Ligilactobacillus agilis]|uniref:transposase n=1 Tax=Ligilactobacillus agilis TaxID=1601 RepID=UPI0035309080